MQKWGVIILLIVSIGSVFFGRFYYEGKLTAIAETAQIQHREFVENEIQQRAAAEEEKRQQEQQRFLELTEGLETAIVDQIQPLYFSEELEEGEKIKILAFGSRALVDSVNEGITPWPVLLEERLNADYGRELFQVETVSLGGATSIEVVQEGLHLDAVATYGDLDIILFEPFVWNSNSGVDIIHTIESMEMIMGAFLREREDLIVYIQPSPPVFNTQFYPLQVEDLKEYSVQAGLNYIDHWQEWPGVEDEELREYVHEEHNVPTQAGHELWSKSISKLFRNEVLED
ncbi:SGNH/GDSL hydrolase family protein [Evansella tamaricis]|uniref:SGNH/GDSL hydrolase family protein n=1 Tax=Evansella tamaricis TaxID=2069301 RepID=A0ABS6JJ53_9BACI|nr:SGNH/GDSL hydrolase family protein [Evansella tamaricis]MBU9713719.1 SGNH/GDSL hydrolase family protein [Evansella tamaricis]